ncbi:hypothetical protein CMV_026144, partial [Castanea mollissima]
FELCGGGSLWCSHVGLLGSYRMVWNVDRVTWV